MNKIIMRLSLAVALSLVLQFQASAAVAPIGLGLFPPVQIPFRNHTVLGVRVNPIYGSHSEVYGVDVGVVNESMDGFAGIGVAAGVNLTKAPVIIGLQAAGIGNFNIDRMTLIGAQIAGIMNSNPRGRLIGVGFAPYNKAKNLTIIGLQTGLVNMAGEVYGFQVGLYNSAQNLHGIQIGLVNINKSGMFSFMPVINIGF